MTGPCEHWLIEPHPDTPAVAVCVDCGADLPSDYPDIDIEEG